MTTRSTMSYQGYTAKIEYDDDDGVFYGDILDLADVIAFSGSSIAELRKGFHRSVDDYLRWCEERGKMPDRPYSGKVQLRFSPSLHRDAVVVAAQMNMSLNTFIVHCIEQHTRMEQQAAATSTEAPVTAFVQQT